MAAHTLLAEEAEDICFFRGNEQPLFDDVDVWQVAILAMMPIQSRRI